MPFCISSFANYVVTMENCKFCIFLNPTGPPIAFSNTEMPDHIRCHSRQLRYFGEPVLNAAPSSDISSVSATIPSTTTAGIASENSDSDTDSASEHDDTKKSIIKKDVVSSDTSDTETASETDEPKESIRTYDSEEDDEFSGPYDEIRELDRATSASFYCFELFGDRWRSNRFFKCKVCSVSVRVCTDAASKSKFETDKVIEHAQVDMERSWGTQYMNFLCVVCGKGFSKEELVHGHLHEDHGSTTNGDSSNLSYQSVKQTVAWICRCFGDEDSEQKFYTGDLESEYNRAISISQYCRRLFGKRWQKQPRIPCNECGIPILVVSNLTTKPTFYTSHAIQHAFGHFGKYLFSCRHCSKKYRAVRDVQDHLRDAHKLSGHKANFEDASVNCRKELIRLIYRCFGPSEKHHEQDASAFGNADIDAKRRESMIRCRVGGDTLKADRHIFCSRLVETHASSKPSIVCLVCKHAISIEQNGGRQYQKVVLHSLTHVGQFLFRCRRCDQPIKDRFGVFRHMKSAHKLTKGLNNEFEDLSNNFHDEIMATFTRCYDYSSEGNA